MSKMVFPLLSSMRVKTTGLIYTPSLAKVENAPTISSSVRSATPKHNDGTGSIGLFTPMWRASVITDCGPYCFISQAVMVFMELAKAYLMVTMPPYSLSLFCGHQSGCPAGMSKQVFWFGNSRQGFNPSRMAVA
jgi:hypothetical protein